MPRRLAHNWDLKLVAVAVAVALWVFVANTDRSQVTLAAPVAYEALPEGLVVEAPPREVEVQLEAARWALARLTPDVVRVRVDLSSAREGESLVRLSAGDLSLPPGVTVTRLNPAWLRVSLAPAAVRSVAVVPQIRGTPAPEHAMVRVRVEPSTVQVKGPRSTIEARQSIETAPVDVTGSRETVTRTVGLVLPDAVYPTKDRTVQVTVDIRPEGPVRSGQRGSSP